MQFSIFTIKDFKNLIKVTMACFLILTTVGNSLFAQYKGAPVKKDRLLKALRAKLLQTGDIVTIINRNGVDFPLTAETKKSLIIAGARPEIIEAVSNNLRISAGDGSALSAKAEKSNKVRTIKSTNASYDELLVQALYTYKDQRNPQNAVQILNAAAKTKPENPTAYQMLGFVYLYGLNDLAQAERSMRESYANGGSAVFRVFHDDNGKFTHRCTGSLYISKNTMRFESDDNVHTFETSTANIDKIKLDKVSAGDWKNRSVFKVTLKFGKEEAKFRFAPLTGLQGESQMVARFIAASNADINIQNSASLASLIH